MRVRQEAATSNVKMVHILYLFARTMGDLNRIAVVPEISRFFGIVIRMYFDDHAPPHFHASYGGHEGRISISPIGVMTGYELPARPLALAVEWATLHQEELLENWELARLGKPLKRIAPLE